MNSISEKEEWKMRRAFFLKNFAIFLLFLLIPILVIGSLCMYVINDHIKNNANNETLVILEQLKSKSEMIVDELMPLVLSVRYDGQTAYTVKRLLNSQEMSYTDINLLKGVSNRLASICNARDYIDSIYIYFRNDYGYYVSNTGKQTIDAKDDSWMNRYKEKKDTSLSWSTVSLQNLMSGEKEQVLSLFYVLEEGRGVLVYNLNTTKLESLLSAGLSDGGHSLLVYNENGEMILGNEKLPDDDNKKMIVHSMTSPSLHWTFYLVSDRSKVFSVYTNVFWLFIALVCISIITGIVFAYVVTKGQTKQIYGIINIIHSSQNMTERNNFERKLPKTYAYLLQGVIENFIQQDYLKAQLEARKYKLKHAELVALQAQLNPHFLFNTLETMNWKAYQLTGRPNELNTMISDLSRLLRYSLSSTEQMMTLQEELEMTKCYVSIQKVRYKDLFDVAYQIDSKSEKCYLPKLLLQPLIENSISHGVKLRASKTGGKIEISSSISSTELVLCIQDNGVGMMSEQLAQVKKNLLNLEVKDEHLGLSNVNTRLKLQFGRGVEIESAYQEGTSVTMRLPLCFGETI